MHRAIDVAGNVVAQVLAHQTHQVVAGVADMVFGLILVPLHAHIAVDRIQALGNGAASLDIGLLDADDLQVAPPISGLVGGATTGHATANDEDVTIHMNCLSA